MGVSGTVRCLLAVRRFERRMRLMAQEETVRGYLYRPRTFELRSKGLPLRGRLG